VNTQADALRFPANAQPWLFLGLTIGVTWLFQFAAVALQATLPRAVIFVIAYVGVFGAILAGAFLVSNVLSQPASPRSTGLALVFDLLWLGVIYGTVDALLLSVLPILATWQSFGQLGWTTNWPGRIAVAAIALLFSLVVTAAYHLGYSEFQGAAVVGPLIGNGVSSLGYLLTNNPLGALLSHIAMHIASVLHGPATTIQLPPHY
jgi:hypothetical protein